jgi:hypothetical protein
LPPEKSHEVVDENRFQNRIGALLARLVILTAGPFQRPAEQVDERNDSRPFLET